ncbi:hypothetical protein QR680_005917 [Steinernema hermaphroditum]|uniref:MADF domain-containing protein n=1 Tax=Steinernema hermaphroditum TaxID=289476 RepID=A0AA39LWI6_9BILA|nr:hypothetical protein QR680_015370 [Steinernema hermaphroditum]KAK0411920.1 hypothetical protein QR680_005917 [Steinernema hermaphroditum]
MSIDDENSVLIELIQTQPILYDLRAEGFCNKRKKQEVWEKVNSEWNEKRIVPTDVESTKARWKNLRATYGRNKKKLPSGSSSSDAIVWPLFSAMRWIDKYEVDRAQLSSQVSEDIDVFRYESDQDENDYGLEGAGTSAPKPKKKKRKSTECTALVDYIQKTNIEINAEERANQDRHADEGSENFHFAMDIAHTLDRLPYEKQKEKKRRIMNIVYEDDI